ncbi:uncharacterized protein A4U43_C05F32500 [Asparagus officinalis]|uniref:Neprosin PEP catalytic domain-containing protein n=1 Tax=Asparagus officinalis TaxID=4686 RepID=A0A5P1F0J3_ASPOF|nr:uncharacterized protein A4U43_C05F32500 [Asparagus officinalis]
MQAAGYKKACYNLMFQGFVVDQETGNWWLAFGDSVVGYWPKENFNKMEKATEVDWGGAVYSPLNEPSPPMGSSHLPFEASYHAIPSDALLAPLQGCGKKKVKMNVTNSEMEIALESMDINRDAPEPALSSTRTGCTTGYATGILIGNKLHLNPITEILQFHPSLKHIDDFEVQKSKNTTQEIIESDKPCVSLKYNSMGSEISRKYLKKMTALNDLKKMTALDDLSTMGPSEYLAPLCLRATVEGEVQKPSSRSSPSSLFALLYNLSWVCVFIF